MPILADPVRFAPDWPPHQNCHAQPLDRKRKSLHPQRSPSTACTPRSTKGEPIIAAGAGTGISAKFIEKGGADLIIIYNSGRFRMMGHGSTAGLMAYGDANAIAMEIGEYEVLPVVEEIPVICGVHATDPRRRMWHWLGKVKDMGFSGVNNFPTHTIVDGHFRGCSKRPA